MDDADELFGAFAGEDKAIAAITPVPSSIPIPSKRKADEDLSSSPSEGAGLVNGAASDSKRPRANKTGDTAPVPGLQGEQEVTKLQPTITQQQEFITADGRRVISFSALPGDHVPTEVKRKDKPAKQYRFELDPFQQAAIGFIERGESVLVAAHTSAGKTVTAEYAIAMSLQKRQRVIYTSPIKALSNQKYRDMAEEFGDVGLMTGDITINPSATCLIMTTEILRSMLYRGSEIMREVAWVVYDEIHYMRDKERGVVWEESIILLPHKVRFVFLSATIPNAQEFAGWIATIHHQPCHVVYTDYRPVPLQHYIFPSSGEGLYLVVDDKSRFREDNFQKAMAVLQAPTEDEIAMANGADVSAAKRSRKKDGGKSQQSDLTKIVRLIMERNYDPVIIFSFSKRECEAYALKMSKLDFNEDSERELVEQVFNNAIDSLAEEDKQLPQVVSILPLLKRGVGIHHGGLLPILKEIIEILFQEGLIKCLFATETFSIGINMPAKTVVFTRCNKFDGKDFRWVTAGEYIQMSGRAGRRGKDDRGIVIMMMDAKMEPSVCKSILYGDPDKLYSSYHVSYNMLLNMLRVQGANPEFLVRNSFHQYQQEATAPALEKEAAEAEAEAKRIAVPDEERVADYYHLLRQVESIRAEMKRFTSDPDVILRFLGRGRLAHLKDGDKDWGWGAVVDYKALDAQKARAPDRVLGGAHVKRDEGWVHVIDVCLRVKKGGDNETPAPYVSQESADFDVRVMSCVLQCIEELSAVRIHMQNDLRNPDSRLSVGRSLREVERRFSKQVQALTILDKPFSQLVNILIVIRWACYGLEAEITKRSTPPLLDPVQDMKIESEVFKTLGERTKLLEEKLSASPVHERPDKDDVVQAYTVKADGLEKVKVLRREARVHQTLAMRDDIKRMKRVLRRMGFIDNDNVLQLKGRVACEINTIDELVSTELIFNGVFNDLKTEQVVALLGCMCMEENKKEGDNRIREDMEAVFSKLKETARAVGKVVYDCKIAIDADEYAERFNPDLIEVLYAWTLGAKFADIIKLTDSFEGTIIRVIRRLEEMLRQLASAAHAIGDLTLKEKFEEASRKIRRDIVFAASLYL